MDVATVAPPNASDDAPAPGSQSTSNGDKEDGGKNLGFIIGGAVMGVALVASLIVIAVVVARLRAQRQLTAQQHGPSANNPVFNEAWHAAMDNAVMGDDIDSDMHSRTRTPQCDTVEFVREQHDGNAGVPPDRTPEVHGAMTTQRIADVHDPQRQRLELDTQMYVEGSAAPVYATVDYADMMQPQPMASRHETEA